MGIVLLANRLQKARSRMAESERRAASGAAEARLLAEELNLLIDGAHGHAIYLLDAEGKVAIWNHGALRLFDWPEAEIIGCDASIFYPTDAIECGKPGKELAQAERQGRFEVEDRRLRKDGSEFLADVSITALHAPDGNLRGFATVVSDITKRRATEDALRSQENHLRSILSTVPDAMIVMDDSGLIPAFSSTAGRMFGYREEELLGTNVKRLMPSPDRERHDRYIRHFLETGEEHIIGIGRIMSGRRRDGSIFPMELSVGQTASGARPLFTAFIRDLTERQKTEARLEIGRAHV